VELQESTASALDPTKSEHIYSPLGILYYLENTLVNAKKKNEVLKEKNET